MRGMGVLVAGPATGNVRRGQEIVSVDHTTDSPEIFRRLDQLSPLSFQDQYLEARVPLKVEVGRGDDVPSPPMLAGGEPSLDPEVRVSVEHRDRGDRIGHRVHEVLFGHLPSDQGPNRIRAARGVARRRPPVQSRQELGFQ